MANIDLKCINNNKIISRKISMIDYLPNIQVQELGYKISNNGPIQIF